jgi:hypothetical protein
MPIEYDFARITLASPVHPSFLRLCPPFFLASSFLWGTDKPTTQK